MMEFKKEYDEIFVDDQTCKLLMLPYEYAVGLTKALLENLDAELKCTYAHSPIHSIKSRIKTPESIIGKLYRRGFEVSRKGLWKLEDIAALRVVCKYQNDIYYIRERLLLHKEIEIVRESDYIKHPKTNGYRSYHMIIAVPVYNTDGKSKVHVEIQIRTIAMDMWASLEHNIHYKTTHKENESINQRLLECSKMLEDVDERMQAIYQELNNDWGN